MDQNCCGGGPPNRQGSCCAPPTKSGLGRNWRNIALIVLLPLVAAVTAYSVFTYENQETAQAAAKIPQIINIENIEDAFIVSHDLVMVLLPGNDGSIDANILESVANLVEAVSAVDGKDVGVFALAQVGSSASSPGVLLCGKSPGNKGYGTRYRVTGEINETRLLQAYQAALSRIIPCLLSSRHRGLLSVVKI